MGKDNHFVDQIIQNRLLSHSLFWLFTLLIAPITSSDSITNITDAFLFRGVALPTKMLATYTLVYYQIPKFLVKRKYVLFLLSLVASSIIFCVIYRFNNIHIAETLSGSTAPKESLGQIVQELGLTVLFYLPRVYFFSLIFLFIKLVKSRTQEKREIEQLKGEKANAELNFLKAQIHPHFLFNTLNNLYALTLDKSDQAPEVVAKLSEMLDYMLYQCKSDRVKISKEVELLNNYIALEKIRYGERLKLKTEFSIEDPNAPIAPLILVSIVENAFKHGVSSLTKDPFVHIQLSVKGEILKCRVFNTKSNSKQRDPMNYKEGIGEGNVKRQLELTYPGKYFWEVDATENTYEVNLQIEL